MNTDRTEHAPAFAPDADRLSLALEAGRMGSWDWDVVGDSVSWSPRQEILFGLEPGTFDGTTATYVALVHPDDRERLWGVVQNAMATGADGFEVRHRVQAPDGAIRWIDCHGRIMYDDAGAPVRVVGVSQDSTGEVLYERMRERQEEMLAAVDVGLWYCDLPFDELIWDRKVKEHFWLPPTAPVTIDTFYERMHPEDRERTRAAIQRSIDERGPYDIEYRTVAPEGSDHAGTVRWVRAIGYTGYDRAGNPIRFDGITVDVTAQKLAAEALAASEERYEYASRATNNAIWDWNLETNRVAWSRGIRAVFGYPESDVGGTGEWWYEHIHPDDRDRIVDGIHRAIDAPDDQHFWTGEYRFRTAEGPYATVIDRGYIMRTEDGAAYRMIGAMEDITVRREMEDELHAARVAAEEANRAKSLFLARMSHDLRTPLNAIGGYAQLMEMGVHGNITDEQKTSLERIQRAQAHLLALINEILSFAKLEAGQVQVVIEAVPVAEVLEGLATLVRPDAERRGLSLEITAIDPATSVIADRERLMQVLLNLTSNAVKFTSEGIVSIRTEAAAEQVTIAVTDTGKGIPPGRLQQIFEPFVQENQAPVEGDGGGVGLGLAISRELVRLMNGELTAESEPGRGSTFTVTLPRG